MDIEDRSVDFIYDGKRCPGQVIEFVQNHHITVFVGGDVDDTYKLNYIGENKWETEDKKGILDEWNYDPNQKANWVKLKR